MDNRSSKIAILSGFLLILLLSGGMIALTLYSISSSHHHMSHLVKDQEKANKVFIMRDIAQKRALLLYRMTAIKDPFDLDDLRTQFSNLAGTFIGARQVLSRLLEKEEVALWRDMQKAVVAGSSSQSAAIRLIFSGKLEEAHEVLRTRVIPAQDIARALMTKMLARQNYHIRSELKNTAEESYRARVATIVMGSITMIVGILAMFYVLRYNSRTEKQLIRQQQLADDANRAKSVFLANMSHEIRTPLTAIIGFSDSLAVGDVNDRNRKECLESVSRNSKHLLQLVNNILDISKIEAGQLDIEKIRTSPIAIASELESIMERRAEEKGLAFRVNCKYPLPQTIETDPVRLKQILINLCGNAIKFTSDGSVSVEVSSDLSNGTITFNVSDTGIGMSEAEQLKLFQPFSQADASTTRKYGGTGLGLAISRQLAEEMGGTLVCTSVKGKGSIFELILPTGDLSGVPVFENDEQVCHDEDEQLDCTINALKGHILLAEDSTDNQLLISMYARKTGAEITVVSNGQEAVDAALGADFDLVLMDIQMPVMGGIEAITHLREKGFKKPVVTLTANATQADRQLALDAGADDFLVKPIDTALFYSILNRYLEKDQGKVVDESPMAVFLGERYQKLVQRFLENLPDSIDSIGQAVEKGDWEAANQAAHKLKGTAGNFGHPEISEMSDVICQAVRGEAFDDVGPAYRNLAEHCKNLGS